MQMTRTGSRLLVKAPAKLNLFLEVLGRRPDGFHDIETVMQTITIWDELTLEGAERDVRLVTDSPEVPASADNLVVRAAEALREHTGCRLGAAIHLKKNIPVGAGLGGGSSDAASTLVGLNRLWKLDLPLERLHDLASQLGSDVAFFLYGGTALCRGRGERVAPVTSGRLMTYVVVYPGINVSTKEVYEKLPADLTRDFRKTKLLLGDITNDAASGAVPRFFNRLEEVTVNLYESLRSLRRQMTRSGLERVTMTGSGSAFFGLARGGKEACESADSLREMSVGEVFIAESTR